MKASFRYIISYIYIFAFDLWDFDISINLSIVIDLKVDELKVKSIFEFDEEFESIRELISPKTLLALDDEISSLQEAKRKLFQRLDSLLNKVAAELSIHYCIIL